jgi:hypothetical protein
VFFTLFDKLSQESDFLMFELLKFKPVSMCALQFIKVVIEGFFLHAEFFCCSLKCVESFAVVVGGGVETTPFGYELLYFEDSFLFAGAFVRLGGGDGVLGVFGTVGVGDFAETEFDGGLEEEFEFEKEFELFGEGKSANVDVEAFGDI